MPRLLHDGEWFEALSADAVFEADYEALLLERGSLLYPGFYLVRFKRKVHSEFGSGIPDLALIDRGYRCWWIVEVELGSHRLEGHVRQQVEIFSNAKYTADDALHLASVDAQLDPVRLHRMMLGASPRVLVLVNQVRPEWTAWLRKYDALVGVAEMFRARTNKIILRINGQHPEPVTDIVTRCVVDLVIPKALIVESPAGLPDGETLDIEFDGAATRWRRMESRDRVWLVPDRRSPLPPGQREYEILLQADGRLSLRVPLSASR